MIDSPVKRTIDVPPAFYRDADPPPPPPDDPHWHEWSHDHEYERIPPWLMYGLPAFLVIAAAIHGLLLLLILKATT